MHTKPNRSTSIRASGNSTSVSPCQGGSAPHRGVSFYLLQLWVYQDGLGYCEHHLSLFSPLLFHDALSRIMFLRLNLSSFLHSTNMLEHLLKGKVLLLACLWPLGLYSSSCPVLLVFFSLAFGSLCKCHFTSVSLSEFFYVPAPLQWTRYSS